ncbi:MAG: acyltransferase family protein [Solirubrobacterales bacterium]
MLCHAEVPFAEGGFVGLDVFYVLSGFLITGLIVREIDRKGKFSIRDFYARRAKRLLPLAALVLIFIAVTSMILFSTVRQIEVGGDIIAASLYFVNWHFIGQEVDYFAFAEGMSSPVQHYWSLSVEEQFYVLWPILLLGLTSLALRFGWRSRRTMVVVLGGAALASLVYSITYTATDPQSAYFSTLTRGWELAFGGILALVLPRALRMPQKASTVMVGGGITAIIAASFLLAETDPYPGWRALAPVLGTMAVIIGGASVGRGLAVRFLSVRPFQYLGKISYAWYLWHWPFIVFAVTIWGEMSPAWLVVVTLAAWIPAEISHRLVEEPFRRSRFLNLRPKRALAIGAVCTLATVVVGIGISSDRISLTTAPETEVAGASVIGNKYEPQEKVNRIKPSPAKARDDRGRMYEEGCLIQGEETESGECSYGSDQPRRNVVLFGDSHALQYSPALERIADNRNWRMVLFARGNCLIADVRFRNKCDTWKENVMKRIETVEKPDLVIISTSTLDQLRVKTDSGELSRKDSQPLMVDGLARVIRRIKATGSKVVVIRDQARAPFIPPECVADHQDQLSKCAFTPERRDEWAFDRDAARRTGVRLIDPMKILCQDDRCPSVIGDALVYRDTYHLSATFSNTLAGWLGKRLPELG